MQKVITYILTLFIFLSALALLPIDSNANPDRKLVQQTILHAKSDLLKTGWTAYPNDGIFWNKTLSNDNDSSYITTTITYAYYCADFTDFIDPGYANETFEVTAWAIGKNSLTAGTFQIGMKSTYASLYTGSGLIRQSLAGSGSTNYHNVTITMVHCPWTNKNWTVAQINAGYIVVDNNLVTLKITEIGMLINTTVPETTTPTDINLVGLFVLVIILIIGTMIYAIYQK